MKRLAFIAFAATLIANDEPGEDAGSSGSGEASEFVGLYSGNSFETAMGMEILADGTWGWALSVGALDMRARGSWEQKGDFIYLTSTPKPVAPEFSWSGLEESEDGAKGTKGAPFIRVVWGTNGKEFQYANLRLTCANGAEFYGQLHYDGYPSKVAFEMDDPLPAQDDPRQSCDVPETVILTQKIHRIQSEPFNLKQLGWKPGTTARFAFNPNDLGVADFTGVTGYLEDGNIKLVGAEWPLVLRKLPPPDENSLPEQ